MRRLLLLCLIVMVCAQPNAASAAERKGRGLVRFQDAQSLSDKLVIDLSGADQPPAGSHYQGWLGSDDGASWQDVGTISVNSRGNGRLEWAAPDQRNLAGSYSRFKVTIEADNQAAAAPSANVAYQGAVTGAVLGPWRALLVSGPDTPLPSRPGLATRLEEEAKDLLDEAREARDRMRDDRRGSARSLDEAMVNRLVGINDGAWGDWDNDGRIEYGSDTYGILRYAATIQQTVQPLLQDPSVSEDSREHVASIVAGTNNVTGWSNQIRNLMVVITPDVNTENGLIVQRDVVWLSRLAVDGFDANVDGEVERLQGEAGARGIYRAAQDMGSIQLRPVQS